MTWVIGASTPFGYGFAISDICVQFRYGETRDMLQKIYPVGNYIVAGFAGSVKIGFLLIDNLKEILKLPEGSENKAWYPDWVAEKFSKNAKEIFDKADDNEKQGRSQILMVGISPNENIGDSDIPKSYISILESPNFEPEIHKEPKNVYSIGSGSDIEEYIKALKDCFDIKKGWGLMKEENTFPGGWGHSIMLTLSDVIENIKRKGISRHLHICIVRRGEIWIENSDRIEEKTDFKINDKNLTICLVERGKNLFKNGSHVDQPNDKETKGKLTIIKMPPFAREYEEFKKMLKNVKGNVRGATC
jgi:hypothetical protein